MILRPLQWKMGEKKRGGGDTDVNQGIITGQASGEARLGLTSTGLFWVIGQVLTNPEVQSREIYLTLSTSDSGFCCALGISWHSFFEVYLEK